MYQKWCGKLEQDVDEECESLEINGPHKQNRVEKIVQQRIELFNLQGFYVQINIESEKEDFKQQGILTLGKWSWYYPKYETSKLALKFGKV